MATENLEGTLLAWVFSLGFIVWSGYSGRKAWATRRLLKIQRRHLDKAPAFTPGLVDCYVRFQGMVELPNTFTTPIRRRACVFYQSRVFAEWKTKEKKPKKGMTTHRKTLYRQESTAQPVKLVNPQGEVYVDASLLAAQNSVAIRLNLAKVKSLVCPEICRGRAEAKYFSYTLTEKWLKEGDVVTVYGKLEKQPGGVLKLAPPGHVHYPAVVLVESAFNRMGARGLLAEVDKKISASTGFVARRLVYFSLGILVAIGLIKAA